MSSLRSPPSSTKLTLRLKLVELVRRRWHAWSDCALRLLRDWQAQEGRDDLWYERRSSRAWDLELTSSSSLCCLGSCGPDCRSACEA